MTTQVHRINLGFVNCYLIESESSFFLVDTGIRGARNTLDRALADAGCKPENFKMVILTHGDIDHSANCVYLRERYGVPIAMHNGDSRMVENAEMMPNRQVKSLFLRMMQAVMQLFGGTNKIAAGFEKFKPDIYLEDGQRLNEFGLDATVLHIPGHTEGSIGILLGNRDFLCGDTLQNNKSARIVDNSTQLDASMERLADFDLQTVYPGHGKPFRWVESAE